MSYYHTKAALYSIKELTESKWHTVYETINRIHCRRLSYFSFLNWVIKWLVLRDSKALQQANKWLDCILAALCYGTCRQLRAASGCINGSNGSFSPLLGLLVPSVTFQAEVTRPTCYPTSNIQVWWVRAHLNRCGGINMQFIGREKEGRHPSFKMSFSYDWISLISRMLSSWQNEHSQHNLQ